MRESLQKNNCVNAFSIIQGGTQLYESCSANQIILRMIDYDGEGNKKELIFLQNAI